MKTQLKFFGVLLLALFLVNSASAQVDFAEGSWDDMKSKAASQDKLIFVDAYAVWCGPCKWMDANVFTNNQVGSFYNDNFINYKFDMEKGEGPSFAKKYNVKNYPTYLFIDAEGNVVHRIIGSRKSDEFIEVGKSALNKK